LGPCITGTGFVRGDPEQADEGTATEDGKARRIACRERQIKAMKGVDHVAKPARRIAGWWGWIGGETGDGGTDGRAAFARPKHPGEDGVGLMGSIQRSDGTGRAPRRGLLFGSASNSAPTFRRRLGCSTIRVGPTTKVLQNWQSFPSGASKLPAKLVIPEIDGDRIAGFLAERTGRSGESDAAMRPRHASNSRCPAKSQPQRPWLIIKTLEGGSKVFALEQDLDSTGTRRAYGHTDKAAGGVCGVR